MKALKISRCFCLGDVVGYGADPAACVDLVRALGCRALMGNHDLAAASTMNLAEMNHAARIGIEFSRNHLSQEQREWLANLPLTATDEDCEFVHSSLDAPLDWCYVISPEDVFLHFEMQSCPICFCGHTHDPMFWHWNGAGKLTLRHGEGRIPVPLEGKTLINVGSVGQPRDENPNACYVIFDRKKREVRFRRVSYDIGKTQGKIAKAKLPHYSADRLSDGR